MNQDIKLLGVVALLEAMPEKDFARGEVGTVVEIVAPGVCEVAPRFAKIQWRSS